jgi:hypothetical protein
VITLAGALPPGRFELDVACPRDSLTWRELEGLDGVSLHAIRPHRRPNPDDIRSELTLLRLVSRADVVHVHSSKAGFLGRLASAVRGKRKACVFSPHGWSFWAAAPVGAVLAMVIGTLLAFPALRLSGIFLALSMVLAGLSARGSKPRSVIEGQIQPPSPVAPLPLNVQPTTPGTPGPGSSAVPGVTTPAPTTPAPAAPKKPGGED